MQDFISNGAGNSRFLKSNISSSTTLEQLIAMLNAGTFPFDLNGVNAAGVAQLGDALNKANLLPDDLCEALGISTDSVPKDALEKITQRLQLHVMMFRTSCVWTAPMNLVGDAHVLVFGAGGGSITNTYGGGGGGHMVEADVTLTPGAAYNVVIGAGGISGGQMDGGASSFAGLTAAGGKGGSSTGKGGDGGSGGGARYSSAAPSANGGNGSYGGGGGAVGTGTPGTGGVYGGNGGGGSIQPQPGYRPSLPDPYFELLSNLAAADFSAGAGNNNTYGGGGGGFCAKGGTPAKYGNYLNGAAGGGGYGGEGSPYGGGGGFFCEGGSQGPASGGSYGYSGAAACAGGDGIVVVFLRTKGGIAA